LIEDTDRCWVWRAGEWVELDGELRAGETTYILHGDEDPNVVLDPPES
jgi:hypothetical protein